MNCSSCGHARERHHRDGACFWWPDNGAVTRFRICPCNHFSPIPDVTITHDEDGMPTRMEFHDEC